jgi:hypothetical protein
MTWNQIVFTAAFQQSELNKFMRPTVIFFSRAYQASLYPLLSSDSFLSIHVTLTKDEKDLLKQQGYNVEYCFEEFNQLSQETDIINYLETSFYSDRFLNYLGIKERKLFLRREIAFWAEIFDKYKPVAIFNEQVAIEISEVMYIEAKKRGIAYKAWMNNPLNGYFYWLANPMNLIPDNKVFEKKPSKKAIIQANNYLRRIRVLNERPYYLQPFLNSGKIKNLLGALNSYRKWFMRIWFKKKSNENIIYESSSNEAKHSVIRSINSFIYKYDSISDLKGLDIIIYPLHYEPESSLLYLSEYFSNQVALIENLSKCIGENQIIVVKEHPAQPGMLLTKRYRELKKRISCLYFLQHTITSYEIIKISKLIVTLTSHLGWEALILGKPVFVLGNMFYKSYPFVNKFESFEDLKRRIRDNDFIYPQEEATLKFVSQLLDHSYKGLVFPCDNLYSEENIADVTLAIEREIKNLVK